MGRWSVVLSGLFGIVLAVVASSTFACSSPKPGSGFGTSSGVCDVIFQTRYPEQVRQRMYGPKRGAATLGARATGAVELDASTRTSSS